MRVKRLRLLGFKSFAVPTTIQFEPGVTAIVGPNGSGKSNIVDSIRWVLGEHNPRDVRAPRLEDIIFNGTDTKAPLSMVEVSLLIENEDGKLPIAFSEVEVARRVYRSGESECFINQNPCRLKDIHELFMGTGLGGGCYAIIEQGHIDLILSSKPEERRVVFEEASGVAKYLSKKAETMRRLDEVEDHLTRLADIIAEVRRQRSALERQAAKARRYKAQWEHLQSGELRLAAEEIRTGERLQQALNERVELLTAQRQAHDADKQRLLASVQAAQAAVAATQTTMQDLRPRIVEAASHIEQHTSEHALKARWIEELTQQRQQAHDEIIQFEERARQLVKLRESLTAQLLSMEMQRADLDSERAQRAQEQAALEDTLAGEAERLAQIKTQVFEVASEASRRRNELSSTMLRAQAVQAQRHRLAEQQQAARTTLETLTQRQAQLDQERAALASQQAECDQQLQTVRHALAEAQSHRHELMGRLTGVRERLLHSQARVQLLEDVWRRYEGFPEAVKALLSTPPEGTFGLLADLLDAQPGYEQALEAALGSLASALVVRDREALRRLQEQVSARELEAVQVVVLSDCPSESLASPPDSLAQCVRSDSAYPQVVAWLLGSWKLVEGLDKLLESTGSATRGGCVSQAGDRWDGTSFQVVGRRRSESMRVGRRQRLERAQEELQALQQELAVAQEAWQRAEEQWQSLTAHEQRIKGQGEQLLPSLTKAEAHLNQLAHETRRAQEELKTHAFDEAEAQRQLQDLTESQRGVQQAADASQTAQQQLEETLKAIQARQEEAAQCRQQAAIAIAQVEAALHSFEERLQTSRQRLTDLESEERQLAPQLEAKRAQAQGMVARAEELSRQLEEHHQRAASLTEEQGTLQAEAERVAQTLREQEEARDQVLPQLLAVEQQVLHVAQQLQEQESRLSELAVRRAHIIERLREVYRLDEAALTAARPSDGPMTEEARQQLTTQVEELKRKLEGVGPISLGSVEEYDELHTRLELLSTQQKDLLASRDDLKASITHINRTARTQFRETFAKIREEFQHYYTRLFNGGEADLIVMDEEDVLESGIEIVARPPGKRLQNISLLSGGERALTAIALLFALFKVRPSPFCILDEIDAPLDEANVDRFTAVLEEFLNLSQFILITHNKKTITKADSLYGVTMEQPGISKIVSVKLTTAKRPAPHAAPEPAPLAEAPAPVPAAA